VESLRARIRGSTYKEDIEIENEKRLLEEKLTLLRTDEEALLRKIREAREATLFEEQKIADIQNDKKGLEIDILSMRAQNEGTKIILRNLEEQNEQLRVENEKLVNKRKVYEPKERDLSVEIEERIRFIKNQQQNLRNLRLYETSKLINSILTMLHRRKLKGHIMQIERFGIATKLAKKKVFNLSLIRKRYVLFIKNQVLQQFRAGFRPLVEQETARRIISETHKRRTRAIVWRKWRRAAK
jgi:predicted RNA-binding protein with RPS1 domain